MRTIVTVLTLLVGLLLTTGAWACDKGDTQKGPNCVHVEEWEVTASAGFFGPLYQSTVYRVVGASKEVVWRDLGVVVVSTEDALTVETRMVRENGEVVVVRSSYSWDWVLRKYR